MASSNDTVLYSLVSIILALGSTALLTHLVTSLMAYKSVRNVIGDCRPPLAPYRVPCFGHGISFFWDTAIVGKVSKKVQEGVVRLKLFTTEINFVNGSDNILAVWRSKDLDAQAVTMFSLKQFFDTPKQSMKAYLLDDSGINPRPHPKSNISKESRYYFENRKHTASFFNGPGLRSMGNRFASLLTREINELAIGHDWTDHHDLFAFIQDLVIRPAVEAMCGPVLFSQNPDFGHNFWAIDSDILYFFKGYPRWLAPKAYANRSKLLRSIKQWHSYARANFDESCIEPDGHDRFYGSPLMRSRQDYLPKVEYLDDPDAIASQDLGLLWAENANSIPAIFWMMYEALQRPALLTQVLDTIAASQTIRIQSSSAVVDVERLSSVPILLSMYSETLRVYTSLFSMRSALHGDFKIGPYTIPQGKLIAVDSRVSAMDSRVWNSRAKESEKDEDQSVEQWWAERFLVKSRDPPSGPFCSPESDAVAAGRTDYPLVPFGNKRYSTEGLAGAWTPYGGGARQCPGRNFAKQEIIVGFGLIFSMLEIELHEPSTQGSVKPNMKYYGLGTLPPKYKVPFHIRWKTQEIVAKV